MKQLLLLAIVLTCFAGLASASITFTNCSVLEPENSGPFNSGVCQATADPGFFISSITMTITSDYTGYQNGSPTVTDTYGYVLNTPGFGGIPNGVVTTTGTNSNPVQNFNQTLTGNFGSSIQVEISM